MIWKLLIASSVTALCATSAWAQDGQADEEGTGAPQINEIVVTAQKREQNLQEVPVAVSAIGGEELQARGITSVTDLTTVTPGLQVTPGGGGVTLPFLRGVGTTAGAVGNESSVAVYLDGIYFTRLPPGFLALNNVERVEVLKGPQGTLFGRNSSGGVINIITPRPSFELGGYGSIGYGNHDTYNGDLYITGGLSEKLAMDLSIGGTYQRDGWGINRATGNRVGFTDDFTVRSKFLFEASDTTDVLLTGFYSYSKSGSQGNVFPGFTRGDTFDPTVSTPTLSDFHDHNSDIDGRLKANFWGVSLRFDNEFEFATFSSITAYTEDREDSQGDGDYGPSPNFIYNQTASVDQLTQEFQLASNDASSPLDWLVGLFYYDTKTAYPNNFYGVLFDRTVFPGANIFLQNFQNAKSYAGYGQATYEVLPNLNVTGGIRYTRDELSGSGIQSLAAGNAVLDPNAPIIAQLSTAADSKVFKKVTFRTAVDYQFTDDILGYVSFSRGFKSAGYNLIPFTAPPQRPETLDAYEVGFKTDLFDRRLRLNMAAFHYDVTDPQVQLLQNGSLFLSNAEASRVNGFEMEGVAAITEAFTARFALTLLDSKYTAYANAPSGPPNPNGGGAVSPLITIDASGNRTPLAPEVVVSFGGDYVIDLGEGELQLTADYYRNSGYFFEPDNLLHQPSYDLISGQVKFSPSEIFAVRAWVKNLLDEEYVSLALTQEGAASYPFLAGPPRTYGVAVDFNF